MGAPGGGQGRTHQGPGHPDDAGVEEGGQFPRVGHRVRRQVERAPDVAEHREPVRLGRVVGVQHLEPEPRQIRYEGQQVGSEQGARHVPAGEDPALLGRGGLLEQEAGPHPHHPDPRMPQFEGVEHPLQIRLLTAVRRVRPAMGRPPLVDPRFRLRSRGVGADRRGVDECRDPRGGHRLEQPQRPEHVALPGDHRVVGGLEPPREVHDRVGAGQQRREPVRTVRPGQVHGVPFHPLDPQSGAPSRQPQDRADAGVPGQRADDARPHVAGRPRDHDAFAGSRVHSHVSSLASFAEVPGRLSTIARSERARPAVPHRRPAEPRGEGERGHVVVTDPVSYTHGVRASVTPSVTKSTTSPGERGTTSGRARTSLSCPMLSGRSGVPGGSAVMRPSRIR